MLFNSLEFSIFLPIVFLLYWFVFHKRLKYQNILIVIVSYIFYGWWDYRFLTLIALSTVVDFVIGKNLAKQNNHSIKKGLLWLSIGFNLLVLGFFKYCNFFIESFIDAFSLFGKNFQFEGLSIVLPVGISFYTFQTLSYTIDVYRNKIEPTHNFYSFAAFVSFFPQLVAGPIERASNLLPQFSKKRIFDYKKASDGVKQILWGLFKKILIADNCAEYVNYIFDNSDNLSGSTLLLGAILFAFQIYGDFSGYSDIAIGVARLFGFNLMQNFAFPYFSRNIGEFWRRWHISLSTWFRDYVYIPLGGSRGTKAQTIKNTLIIFLVSGFWHGANWTFIIWGCIHALLFLPLILTNNNRNHLNIVAQHQILPSISDSIKILFTFLLTVLAWVFFRAENVSQASQYIVNICSSSLFQEPEILPRKEIILIFCFIVIEWLGRTGAYGIQHTFKKQRKIIRYLFYYILIFSIIWFRGKEQTFIYFQF